MLRTITAALLSLALFLPAQAGPYKDPDGRFAVTLPSDWDSINLKDRRALTFAAVHVPTDSSSYLGVCLGMFTEVPTTRNLTQEELNNEIDRQLTPEMWRESMKSANDADVETTIETTGSRSQSGRSIHHIVYLAKDKKNSNNPDSKGKMEMHFVPGSLHVVMCGTEEPNYPAVSPIFESIFTSYEPGRDALVSSNEQAAPSVLTMFAQANYAGQARVLSKDTPDLAAAGWPTSSPSLTVDGAEPWQVCTGIGFSGTCRTVVGPVSGRPIVVGSARRLAGKISFSNLAATAIRRVLQHPEAKRQRR